MASPGMPAIHGCVACLHADPTERFNTRPISCTTASAPRPELPLCSSLIRRRNSQKARTIQARSLRLVDAGRGGAPCGSPGCSSEEPALHCGVVRLPPSGPRRGDICSFKSALRRRGSRADETSLFLQGDDMATVRKSRDYVRQTTAAMSLAASLRSIPAFHSKRSPFDV
jgi:hypothetical protein